MIDLRTIYLFIFFQTDVSRHAPLLAIIKTDTINRWGDIVFSSHVIESHLASANTGKLDFEKQNTGENLTHFQALLTGGRVSSIHDYFSRHSNPDNLFSRVCASLNESPNLLVRQVHSPFPYDSSFFFFHFHFFSPSIFSEIERGEGNRRDWVEFWERLFLNF